MNESSNFVGEEYYRTHLCEFCKSKNLPILTLAIAEKINASIGVLVIRKNKITWDETGRTVLCYQCMRKTNEDDEICTKDEKPIHEFHWTGQSLAFLTPSLFGQLVSRPIYLVD